MGFGIESRNNGNNGSIFGRFVGSYVKITDKTGAMLFGKLESSDFEGSVLKPFLTDVSENPSGIECKLLEENIYIMPTSEIRSVIPISLDRINNVIIPWLNRSCGSGTQGSIYIKAIEKDNNIVYGDGEGI